jgi:hypothetical protein
MPEIPKPMTPVPSTEGAVMRDMEAFAERGISQEVRDARPYVRWTPADVAPIDAAYGTLTRSQLRTLRQWAHQSPGWIITRHAPPELDLSHVYPEIRPDNEVCTNTIYHFHGDVEQASPDDQEWCAAHPRSAPSARAARAHISGVRNPAADDHAGVNTDKVHAHAHVAKYLFPPGAKVPEVYSHDHGRMTAARRRLHVDREHQGIDDSTVHEHTRDVKDPDGESLAKRIDVQPLALAPIIAADTIFFVIEGCFKADAILCAGGAVFSVPSVTLWDADELPAFVDRYLHQWWVNRSGDRRRGDPKTVVIVPDADWATNDLVVSQARCCQSRLMRLGIDDVHVAAPPVDEDWRPTRGKGVDDFLGRYGGQLEELQTLDNIPPDRDLVFQYMLARGARIDTVNRNTEVLMSMAVWAGANGAVQVPYTTMGKVMGIKRDRVRRAINDLARVGAVDIEGSLETRLGWFSHSEEWRRPPTITVAPELRAVELEPFPLGDVVPSTREMMPQFQGSIRGPLGRQMAGSTGAREASVDGVSDMELYHKTYQRAERGFYPRGVPSYLDAASVRFRVIIATLMEMRQRGTFHGDPRETALRLSGKVTER